MYSVNKIKIYNIVKMLQVCGILYKCGKHMAANYNLNHWNNNYIKNFAIVLLCTFKNQVYLVYDKKVPVATFQTRKVNNKFLFQKLATLPEFSGRGIGSFCLNEIENYAKAQNCNEVICEVYDKSDNAKNFYKHKGYTVYGQIRTLKYNELKLRKEL